MTYGEVNVLVLKKLFFFFFFNVLTGLIKCTKRLKKKDNWFDQLFRLAVYEPLKRFSWFSN